MGRKISLFLFVLALMAVAPVAAEEPKVVAKRGEPSLESREQKYPETAAMLDRITAIIEGGGDLQDISYIEKLFDVHFSEPTYFNNPTPLNGGPPFFRIERSTIPKSIDGAPVKFPELIIYHRISISGIKESPSEPYPPPTDVSIDISFSNHICFRVADFQPLFDTGPAFVPAADAGAHKYEKSVGTKAVSLIVVEAWGIPSVDKRIPVNKDVNRSDCPVTSINIDFSYVPTSHPNNGGLQWPFFLLQRKTN